MDARPRRQLHVADRVILNQPLPDRTIKRGPQCGADMRQRCWRVRLAAPVGFLRDGGKQHGQLSASQLRQPDRAQVRDEKPVDVLGVRQPRGGPDSDPSGQPIPQPPREGSTRGWFGPPATGPTPHPEPGELPPSSGSRPDAPARADPSYWLPTRGNTNSHVCRGPAGDNFCRVAARLRGSWQPHRLKITPRLLMTASPIWWFVISPLTIASERQVAGDRIAGGEWMGAASPARKTRLWVRGSGQFGLGERSI